MANPFSLKITGVNSGNDILALPAPTSPETPFVDLGSLNLTMSGDGGGGSMAFDVIQPRTPAAGAWWRSGAVYDNARVQFFDSRVSSTTPIFLGYITNLEAQLLENGLGTRCSVSAEDADGWLGKTIVRNGKSGIKATSFVDSFKVEGSSVTDQQAINALLARVDAQVNDATTRQLLDTSIISGSTRAIYSGSAQTIGTQAFRAGTLQSALDQVAEAAAGIYGVRYRYFVDNDGRLNYGPVEAAPTYANAPAEIVVDPALVATGSRATSTTTKILAHDLRVTLDHDRIVKGVFVMAESAYARYDSNQTWPTAPTNDPYFRSYTGTYSRDGAGLTARNGALPHQVFSAPKVIAKSDRGAVIGSLARATMQSLGKPVRSVSFTVRGANIAQTGDSNTPDWSYGYSQGVALTAAATYTLVKSWQPGQYVKINDTVNSRNSLDLSSAILRIASVSLSFESGSTYQVKYDIEADYRRQPLSGKLANLIGGE